MKKSIFTALVAGGLILGFMPNTAIANCYNPDTCRVQSDGERCAGKVRYSCGPLNLGCCDRRCRPTVTEKRKDKDGNEVIKVKSCG